MSRLKLSLLASTFAAGLAMTGAAQAASFTNGDFETGDYTGWTQGGGSWGNNGGAPCGTGTGGGCLTPPNGYQAGVSLVPSLFLPGGTYSVPGAGVFVITNPGTDPATGGALPTVYAGQHSARLNDSVNNYSVSAISQKVTNYTDSHVYFAWAAVLEGSHTATDSDNFSLSLVDTTSHTTIYSVEYSSASASGSGLFHQFGVNYYTDWQVQNIDLSQIAGFTSGDDLELDLMGADCPYGGHYGYVYLDGFGAVAPPSGVPEPATLTVIGAGMAALGLIRRRRAR